MNPTGSLADAVAMLQSGKTEDALKHLARIVSTQPGNADAFGWLAIAHSRNRQSEQAQQIPCPDRTSLAPRTRRRLRKGL